MSIAPGIVYSAFFFYGVFQLGGILYRWLLTPRENAARIVEEQRRDPPAASEREGMQAGLLVPAAFAAWLWADLRFIWLFVAVILALSATSGFMTARRMRAHPALLEKQRAFFEKADVQEAAARGRRIGALASGLALIAWLYSWSRPLREFWESLSAGSTL